MTAGIILAAGQGKRMKSPLPKVMHPVLGEPMVMRVIRQARAAGLQRIVVVVGHGRERIIPLLEESRVSWAVQEKQLGTAHAVMCGLEGIVARSVTVLLGDVPLISSETISRLERRREEEDAAIAVLTTIPPDPSGYGRIVREGDRLRAIVEHRDCNRSQLEIREINTGLMSFDGELLPGLLDSIGTDNDQGEYYLTDAVKVAVENGHECIAVKAGDHMEVSGVNNRVQLSMATEHLRGIVNQEHLMNGVDIPDPGSVWIEESVTIGSGVTVGRSVRLSGSTRIGDDCMIGDCSVIVDTLVTDGERVRPFSVMGWEKE